MMIQSAPPGEPHFLCTMRDHNAMCASFARAFGNDRFERLEPFEEMVYAVGHHDYGWDEFDANPVLDPKSGLPCGVGGAPVPGGSATGRRSADVNERHHPYCGLVSSMHSWGLYNARYGFSEFRIRPGGSTSIPMPGADPAKSATEAMLAGEIARQERLRAELAADPKTRPWVEERHLAQCYKQLQLFDTLALYFHLRHETERGIETFVHVPMTAEADATVTVTPKGGGAYALDPFPFAGDRLEAGCPGRYFTRCAEGKAPADLAAAIAALPPARQGFVLLAG